MDRHGGREEEEEPRRERVYFTPTLFYTVSHPFYARSRGADFQRHGGGKRSPLSSL